jgi:hypothetical protein
MPTDGYSENINYIRLSNAFPYYHRNIFGLSKSYQVGYIDSLSQEKTTPVPIYNPQTDTSRKQISAGTINKSGQRPDRRKKREEYRSLEIDTVNETAVMYLYSFDNGYGLKKFYRKSFKKIQKENIKNQLWISEIMAGKRIIIQPLPVYKDTFKVADTFIVLKIL